MITALLLLAATALPEDAVVRVQVYRARPDWSLPWRVHPVESGLGSGFIIDGGLIVTNAHVVRDARQILIKRHHFADPFVAKVEAIGHDCDLAVLKVEDPEFHKGLKPLKLGALPKARSKVTTYGFPLGGEEVSSTGGIVSRVEFKPYAHTGWDAHLVVQTDAAINPGNSGGPVVQDGKVVGVAFQGIPGYDNVGFFIPAPVVQHFLDDIKDGTYHGFPDDGLRTQELTSPALKRERGVPAGKQGVVVDDVLRGGSADGVLMRGDVILAVEGQPVADDGSIALGEARVPMSHALDLKQVGQPARFHILRDGKEMDVTMVSRRLARGERHRNQFDVAPRYLVYGGLVFMTLDVELLKTYGDWRANAPRELLWHQIYREWETPEAADREVVVLARVLRHPVNSQMSAPVGGVIRRVNGREITSLKDLAEALAQNQGKHHVFEFETSNQVEAMDRAKADAAHATIMKTYGIPRDRNL
ncbi:MAG: trypsin-like peptidase domain-containing protein [Myxococcota bacterium]